MGSRTLRLLAAATVALGAFAVGVSTPAQAAKPEPLAVKVQATTGPIAGSAQYTFEINTAARQIASVSVTLNGVPQDSPTLNPLTSKSSGGSASLTGLPPGTYSVVVTVTPKRGTPVSGSSGFTIAPTATPTDAEKLALASAWCGANSGTFETGQDYRLGSNYEGTIDYWVYGAFWACMHADSAWSLSASNGVDTLLSTYCVDVAAPTRGFAAGMSTQNTALDNFVCGAVTDVLV